VFDEWVGFVFGGGVLQITLEPVCLKHEPGWVTA
jgi:hypothetical protein